MADTGYRCVPRCGEVVIGQRLSAFEGDRGLTLGTGAFPRCGDCGCDGPAPCIIEGDWGLTAGAFPAVCIGQRLSTVEGDRGLTLVTGAFPAVVTAVVIGQRLSIFEGDRGLTLGYRCVPRCDGCSAL